MARREVYFLVILGTKHLVQSESTCSQVSSGGFDRLAALGEPDGASIVTFSGVTSLSLQPGTQNGYSVVRWRCSRRLSAWIIPASPSR